MSINYKELKLELDKANVKLIAVSKTQTIEAINNIYEQGQRAFGENRVQEMVEKKEALNNDIEWHMIGYLQRNKVKYIAPFVSMIHSVDNMKLAKTVDKEGKKNERIINILLQVKIAQEDTKSGFDFTQLIEEIEVLKQLESINICGLMGMGTFTNNTDITHAEFKRLKSYFDQLKEEYFSDHPGFKEISMGMSGDYPIAIKEGSTMVRIGSLLFGARNY